MVAFNHEGHQTAENHAAAPCRMPNEHESVVSEGCYCIPSLGDAMLLTDISQCAPVPIQIGR